MTAWTLKKLPSLGENLRKSFQRGQEMAAPRAVPLSPLAAVVLPSGGCCERCDAAEPSAPAFGHRWHRRSRRSRNVAALYGSRFTSRSSTFDSVSRPSVLTPRARHACRTRRNGPSYMLARPSESYAPSPNDLWLHCTMVGWRIDGMERCGHNRVWVADVRRAMAPSGAGPVHGSYKRP